jgi:ferredoxin-NADP reductase
MLLVNPIWRGSGHTDPQKGEAGGAQDKGQAVSPPDIDASAPLDPSGRHSQHQSGRDCRPTPLGQAEQHAPDATHRRHAGSINRVLTLPIQEVVAATPRACIVRLDLQGQPFKYAAGQAVLVANHGHEQRRPYSLAGSPSDAERDGCLELLVGLKGSHHPGPHLTLAVGQRVDVEGPVGQFTLPDQARPPHFVFVAGGTGIAPLRAMLHGALEQSGSTIGVLYSARTPGEFAYETELRALAARGRIELLQTVTRGGEDDWPGRRGRIGRRDLETLVHDRATWCFICGPRTLLDEIPRLLGDIGVARDRIRIEEWG